MKNNIITLILHWCGTKCKVTALEENHQGEDDDHNNHSFNNKSISTTQSGTAFCQLTLIMQLTIH